MEANNNTKGILFIMIGMAFFSIQDSLIKYIFEEIALFELYLGRTIVQATVLISIFLITKKKFTLKTHYPLLTLLRVAKVVGVGGGLHPYRALKLQGNGVRRKSSQESDRNVWPQSSSYDTLEERRKH